jgi:hypothetical protein
MAKRQNKKTRKQNARRKFKGGLKQKNPNLTSWQCVYKMITCPSARLSKIAFSSLKGFIFRLDVPPMPENSEFFGLNDRGTDFTKPIYSLIFKFAIIGEDEDDLDLPNLVIPGDKNDKGQPLLGGREKETEDLTSFKIEADIQQQIYAATVTPTAKPISLAVVDFSTFNTIDIEGETASETLLRTLLTKSDSDTASRMLNYLITNVTPGRTLGLMTMELANPEFRELGTIEDDDAFFADCNYGLAQLFVLFAKLKTINYDCHMGNILGSRIPPAAGGGTDERSVLIDFGRTLNLTKPRPFPADAGEIMEKYNVFSGSNFQRDLAEVLNYSITDFYVSRDTPEDVVIDRMQKVIKFVSYLDYATNTTYFNMDPANGLDRPQLISLLDHIYGNGVISRGWIASTPDRVRPGFEMNRQARGVYASLIPLIRAITEAPLGAANRLSSPAIQSMMDDGRLFSVKPRVSYNRSNVSAWIVGETPATGAALAVTTRSTAAAAAIAEQDLGPRRTRAGNFSGGKSKKQKKSATKKRRRY